MHGVKGGRVGADDRRNSGNNHNEGRDGAVSGDALKRAAALEATALRGRDERRRRRDTPNRKLRRKRLALNRLHGRTGVLAYGTLGHVELPPFFLGGAWRPLCIHRAATRAALQKRRGTRGASPYCVAYIVTQPVPFQQGLAERIQTKSTGATAREA